MAVSLEIWQKQLEKHFSELAAVRAVSGYPLFALEHNLTKADLKEVGELLDLRLADGLRLSPHWLVWVVYATEVGYEYEGDEYWSSYEERTPHWRENANRSQLRDWFYKFKATYHGVEPSGPWAEWFSIIAWPITHAILPKYLQLQLVRFIYRLRYRLSSLETLSPEALGKLLAAESWDASSRLSAFLEQEELAGRIVLALLNDTTPNDHEPIYTPTLQRIVSDLEQVRSAREWLNEAQRVIASRFKGAAHGAKIHGEAAHSTAEHASAMPAAIRTTLLLRPSGAEMWSIVIEAPNFGAVSRLHPDLREFLASTRCRVAGAGDTWMPAGWLLSNSQRRVLKTWPGPAQSLINFERQNGKIENLLTRDCRLSPGSIWLCRIGSDGIAREIASRLVRPGNQYIILSPKSLDTNRSFMNQLSVNCADVEAYLLTLPEKLDSQDVDWLGQLGLRAALTIRIWPAGLSSRGWDGEGHSEWLTSESPCFGIVHDQAVESYELRLNNGVAKVIAAGGVGVPVFVRLDSLPIGRHILSVRAGCAPLSAIEGVVTLDVREPEPWIPGTTSHAGLAVTLDPPNPSLDAFWEGAVRLSILGPENRQAVCLFSLANAAGTELLSREIGKLELPVLPETWTRKFSSFTRDDKHEWAFLEATSGRLIIKGEELGEYVGRFERSVRPIRWVCRAVHRSATLRLIDDTGRAETACVQFFSFGRPAKPNLLPTGAALDGFKSEAPGGLYSVQNAQHRDCLVVSTPQISNGFRGLVANADLSDLQGNTVSTEFILQLLDRWVDARLAGPLAKIRRDRVIKSLTGFLYARLCGLRWARAEEAYLSCTDTDSALQNLEAAVGGSSGFAATLRRNCEKMEEGTELGVRWFASVASRYDVSSEPRLCDFALRLASQPNRLPSIFGSELYSWLSRVNGRTILLRGARFIALLSAVGAGEADAAMPRWKWS